MSVSVSRGDYDDEVLAEGYKHRAVVRSGQCLVLRNGQRWPDEGGDHGSTRDSRERALAHFRYLEAPYFEENA
jgi:hypothetical protein